MNIVVCIKHVIQYYVQSGFDAGTRKMKMDGLVYRVNPYDETAIEMAVRIKEKVKNGTVMLLTMGPPRAEQALRWGLSMGADEAIHILTPETTEVNPWKTAAVLTRVIGGLACDLVFFGKMAIDDEMGVTGTYVAEMLNLPVVTNVCRLDPDIESGMVLAHRVLEKGNQEVVTSPLPAVFTMDRGITPRYPTFIARKAAGKMVIRTREGMELLKDFSDLPAVEIEGMAPPKLRPKKILAPDSGMSAAGRIQFIMKGGLGNKKSEKLDGNPDQLASGILDFLIERRFIAADKEGKQK